MRVEGALLLSLIISLVVGGSESAAATVKPSHYTTPFNRTLFPSDFLFGVGSSAYQATLWIDDCPHRPTRVFSACFVLTRTLPGKTFQESEGASNIDGKGPSIWDTFTKHHREKIRDHSSGDVTVDFYHRYKADIKVVKEMGLDSFRFSISWSRIFPKGKGAVNSLGVKFYNNLINEILSNGLTLFVTLFHWDLPQASEDEYGGFRSRKIVEDFHNYADFCFKTFGDRVKHWVTLNEPYIFTINGYNSGTLAPGRCSNYIGNCIGGNSATEPYIIAHNLLLSHAAVVTLYKTKYQVRQKGQIGITLVTHYFEPKSNSDADHKAASRALDFMFGWYAHPITYGDYPKSMRSSVGKRLPKFTKAESESLKGAHDFLGVNYYTTNFAEHAAPTTTNTTFFTDMQVTLSTERNGLPIGTPTAMDWLFIYPKGIHQLMTYIKDNYNSPPIYITENGFADARNDSIPINEARKDSMRIKYHDAHLKSILQAIKDGVNMKGYYAWSFSDSFEWNSGYSARFGLIYVDYKNLRRYPKYSAFWLQKFLLK